MKAHRLRQISPSHSIRTCGGLNELCRGLDSERHEKVSFVRPSFAAAAGAGGASGRKSYVQGLISTKQGEKRTGRTTEWETELVRGMSVPNEANANGHRGRIAFLSYLHGRMYFFAGKWVLSSAREGTFATADSL